MVRKTGKTSMLGHLSEIMAGPKRTREAQRAAVARNALLHALPLDLVGDCLAFLSVEDLLLRASRTSRAFLALSNGLMGRPTTVRVAADVALSRRYSTLHELRGIYETLRSANNGRSLYLRTALQYLCVDRYTDNFDELVNPEDEEVQLATGVGTSEYQRTDTSFALFVTLYDTVGRLVQMRQKYLLQHFVFTTPRRRADGTEQPMQLAEKGRLTKHGIESCNRIFDFFDIDSDGRLGWEELSAINHAAGLPLSRSAFVWVQQTYETDFDGNLTRQGYRDMFLENFLRVPRLMYKDLIRLHEFIDKAEQERSSSRTRMDSDDSASSNPAMDVATGGPEDGTLDSELDPGAGPAGMLLESMEL